MDQLQVLCLPTVRKISGESDPVEAPGKDVLQEHPDKISTSDGKCFLAAPVGIVLITESYMCIRIWQTEKKCISKKDQNITTGLSGSRMIWKAYACRAYGCKVGRSRKKRIQPVRNGKRMHPAFQQTVAKRHHPAAGSSSAP